jgi:hypothetical protein
MRRMQEILPSTVSGRIVQPPISRYLCLTGIEAMISETGQLYGDKPSSRCARAALHQKPLSHP